MKGVVLTALVFLIVVSATAQKKSLASNPVYVDKQGVLRYTGTKKEAAFFGVNYTVPFAYGYRSHQALNMDIEKAIDNDVYHFARLGLDAFRVHVWDTEISDSLGNLLTNEHLRLYDYLLYKLKERNIKVIVTPIAFWGNGYPQKDEQTNSFVSKYGKGQSVVNEEAFKAQERYLQQLFTHVNPYTKLSYGNDANVLAVEINNEPHHSGPKPRTTEYINRMAAAIRNTGWTKPVFYNISESPAYADAVAKANVDGFSFQWYPTGLVANHTLNGNFLPNVDAYKIPFGDTIPQFFGKARMVYEFDAGDVLQSDMYPAMARSFRTAGFQWATQFAYDPMATAYANTEYQTHYLNLAYTPSKAISLMIAGKAFRQVPRNKNYGTYPADTLFENFRVSYSQQLSEMNSTSEFYYSNTTTSKPIQADALQHIAGVGSSTVIQYKGKGAYFLDKINDNNWRLEVMPDAVQLRDPFEKASPEKTVIAVQYATQQMHIDLPGLQQSFTITGLNKGNEDKIQSSDGSFDITPGTYLLSTNQPDTALAFVNLNNVGLREFVAPLQSNIGVNLVHNPATETSAGKPFKLRATITGLPTGAKVRVEVRNTANAFKTIAMDKRSPYDYAAVVPADIMLPGLMSYRFIVQHDSSFTTFPGAHKGDPYAWDNYDSQFFETFVAMPGSPLQLFDANNNRQSITMYNPDWKNITVNYLTGNEPGRLVMKTNITNPAKELLTGWQLFVADKLLERQQELEGFNSVHIKARSTGGQVVQARLTLISKNAVAFSASIIMDSTMRDIVIPFSELKQGDQLLLPRPYPGFLPLLFVNKSAEKFELSNVDKIELRYQLVPGSTQPYSIEVAGINLQ